MCWTPPGAWLALSKVHTRDMLFSQRPLAFSTKRLQASSDALCGGEDWSNETPPSSMQVLLRALFLEPRTSNTGTLTSYLDNTGTLTSYFETQRTVEIKYQCFIWSQKRSRNQRLPRPTQSRILPKDLKSILTQSGPVAKCQKRQRIQIMVTESQGAIGKVQTVRNSASHKV